MWFRVRSRSRPAGAVAGLAMDPMTQVLLTVTIPTVTVLVGILVNNSRLTDLRNYVDIRAMAADQHIEI